MPDDSRKATGLLYIITADISLALRKPDDDDRDQA